MKSTNMAHDQEDKSNQNLRKNADISECLTRSNRQTKKQEAETRWTDAQSPFIKSKLQPIKHEV